MHAGIQETAVIDGIESVLGTNVILQAVHQRLFAPGRAANGTYGQSRNGKTRKLIKTEANSPWPDGVWTSEQDDAFESLKGALLTRPVLNLPIAGRKWRLATDASKTAMGAVLSQIDEEGDEHPIAYYSRKLLAAETRWDIQELELAAIVWAQRYAGTTSDVSNSR